MEEVLKEMLSQMQVMSNKLQTVSDKQDEANKRLDDINQRLDGTNQRLTKLESSIENNIGVKIQALFEDREIIHSKLDNIANELADVKARVTDHDVKIQVINTKAKAYK